MPINLSKGGSAICLDKLTQITVGLGWDLLQGRASLDLDASIAGLTANSKLLQNEWFVFYNNLQSPDGSIVHMGDAQGGTGGRQDDESINIDLTRIPPQIVKILVIVSIHAAGNRSFADLRNAYLRIVNGTTGVESHRLELNQFGNNQCMVLAEINRSPRGQWEINPVCLGVPSLDVLVGNIQLY
mmetsp:Transcript_40598/g.86472  ORF Transcript_40598/g.86472 Transcript_40598/m.86472 type:complete len:185 (-) Transcript_40598:8-562(-)